MTTGLHREVSLKLAVIVREGACGPLRFDSCSAPAVKGIDSEM
jgi:hypothetical protein